MWLFKPQDTLQTLIDMAASRVAQAAGVASPIVHSVDCYVKGQRKKGSIQPVLDIQGGIDADLSLLTPQQQEELRHHQVVDWLLGNVDAHRGQFLIFHDGTLVGIDKSQAMRFFPHDRLGWNVRYWPLNVRPPVYNHYARAIKNGDISPKPQAPLNFAKQVHANVKDDWLRMTWEPIVTRWPWHRLMRAATATWLSRGSTIGEVLDKIIRRKRRLEADFDKLYKRL